VEIATCYGPNSLGLNPGGGQKFSVIQTHPNLSWSLLSLHYDGYWDSSPRAKRSWHGFDHPSPSSVEVENR
jgi:hypothetical protein